LSFAAAQFRFRGGEVAELVLPFRFESASHQPVFGIHGPITPPGAHRLIAGALYFQSPPRQRRIAIGLQLFDRQPCSSDGGWRNGLERGVRHSLLDYRAANVQTVHAAPLDEIFAGAVITGSGVTAAMVNMQKAAAMPARDQPLQKRRSFSHSSSRLVRLRSGIGIEPRLIGLERGPIDEAAMMVPNENGPLLHR
jgi:hypothetical protein